MASSFVSQIPVVVYLIQKLAPRTLLDIGKGFGKYGFLAHEYAGVPNDAKADPARSLASQSRLTIDAVEVEPDFLWPHLSQIYRTVHVGRIEELYGTLPDYDVVLMADVIEHLSAEAGREVVDHFVRKGSKVIVSTPKQFFQQEQYESTWEAHVSHWPPRAFDFVPHVTYQNVGPGRIYLLSAEPVAIRGFGNDPATRARRVLRMIRDEFV